LRLNKKIKIYDQIIQFLHKNLAFPVVALIGKFEMLIVYYTMSTILGYSLYLFCFFYGFFGCNSIHNCNYSHGIAAIFVCYIIKLIIQFFLICKFQKSREYLYILVDERFVKSCLGEFPATKVLLKAVVPLFSAGVAEIGTRSFEHVEKMREVDALSSKYYEFHEKHNLKLDPNSVLAQKYLEDVRKTIKRPTAGIITRACISDANEKNASSLANAFAKIFGKGALSFWHSLQIIKKINNLKKLK
jgi:hypothetical protein